MTVPAASPTAGTADLHRDFAQADTAIDARPMYAFLDAVERIPEFAWYKRRLRGRLELQHGDTVLDAGCGVGYHACRLAIEYPGSRVIGLDRRTMLEEAERRAEMQGADVRWLPGSLEDIPLAKHMVDACLVERVLMYLPDPEEAMSEVARVLRPGGRFACFELDYASTMVGGPEDMADTVVDLLCDSVSHPRMGRRLPHLLRSRNFTDISFQPVAFHTPWPVFDLIVREPVRNAVTTGRVPETSAAAWLDQLSDPGDEEVLTSVFVGVLASGRLPAGG